MTNCNSKANNKPKEKSHSNTFFLSSQHKLHAHHLLHNSHSDHLSSLHLWVFCVTLDSILHSYFPRQFTYFAALQLQIFYSLSIETMCRMRPFTADTFVCWKIQSYSFLFFSLLLLFTFFFCTFNNGKKGKIQKNLRANILGCIHFTFLFSLNRRSRACLRVLLPVFTLMDLIPLLRWGCNEREWKMHDKTSDKLKN